MIRHQKHYLEFIQQEGVGEHDVVADSRKSYVSYLNSVSDKLLIEIGPLTAGTDADVERLCEKLHDRGVPKKTISNYKSALRQYVKMVESLGLK
jgi:site-specific recombinase XerC